MTFTERYNREDRWWAKALIMEIYHLNACAQYSNWTLSQTATVFGCSLSLVSENLKLAQESHVDAKLFNIETREKALQRIRR